MAESLQITSVPDGEKTGTYNVEASITTEEKIANNSNIVGVEVDVELILNGKVVQTRSAKSDSGTTFNVAFAANFDEAGSFDVIVKAELDYGGEPGFNFDENADATLQDSRTVRIRERTRTPTEQVGFPSTSTGYANAFEGRSDTVIESITTDDDVVLNFNTIDFAPYGNPSISVDTSARFAVHDILGGTTVRQKIGEKPREISINGVCTEPVARKVNQLNKVKLLSVNSDVIGDIVRCQVASTSTDPLDDGGAADMDGGEFLYDFSMSLVEVGRERSETGLDGSGFVNTTSTGF